MSRRPAAILFAFALLVFTSLTWRNLADRTREPEHWQPPEHVYPRVVVNKKQIVLGTVKARQTISNCITIRNDGSVTLRLDLIPTGCRAPKPYFDWENTSDYHTIAPGESTNVSVFVPALGTGGPHHAAFEIRTDDPRNARIPITIRYSYPIDENV